MEERTVDSMNGERKVDRKRGEADAYEAQNLARSRARASLRSACAACNMRQSSALFSSPASLAQKEEEEKSVNDRDGRAKDLAGQF